MKLEKKIIQFRLAYSYYPCINKRKLTKDTAQFPHPRAGSPKRRYLDVSLIIRNQSRTRSSRYPQCSLFQLLLSFHFGHVRRFAWPHALHYSRDRALRSLLSRSPWERCTFPPGPVCLFQQWTIWSWWSQFWWLMLFYKFD